MSLERGSKRERERGFENPDRTGERVLEYLFETQSALPSPAIAWNLSERGPDATAAEVERRLTRLERAGLVERVGADGERDYYRVTDDGVAYLGGLFDPADGERTA